MTENQVARQLELLSAETERKIAAAYAASRERIRSKMAELYEKYSIDGELTYAEMSKYNRMASLNQFIADEMKSLGKEVDALTKQLAQESYEKAFYEYGAVISDQAGAALNFGVVSRDTLASLVNVPNVSGVSLVETLTAARYNSLLKERQTIVRGLIQGESFVDMAKRIKDTFDMSFNNALRIARTEGTRAAGEGQAASYDRAEEIGVEVKRIWVAQKTSERHGKTSLQGQVADKDGYFHLGDLVTRHPGGFGVAAQDINCKCRIRAEVVTDE